jgi:hypothetical protein
MDSGVVKRPLEHYLTKWEGSRASVEKQAAPLPFPRGYFFGSFGGAADFNRFSNSARAFSTPR